MHQRWGQIPIELNLMLGSVELTVAECAALTVGSRLTLPTPRGVPVPVVANHEVLGHGRLVLTEDGRLLACEITNWTLTASGAMAPGEPTD